MTAGWGTWAGMGVIAVAMGALCALSGCDQPLEPHPSKLERVAPTPGLEKMAAVAPSPIKPYEPPCTPIAMPNLPHLERYDCAIRDALRQYAYGKIAPENILAQIEVESDGRMDAVSEAGARCAMQLLPGTFASMLPRGDIADVKDCIRAGVKYRKYGAEFWHSGLRTEEERWGPLSEIIYHSGARYALEGQGKCGGYDAADILPCMGPRVNAYVVRIAGLEAGRPRGWWRQ